MYSFSFNGKEKDDEVYGSTCTSLDFGARLYDLRVGRWLSLDPMSTKYASESNYLYTSGNPILFMDQDGKDRIYYMKVIDKQGRGHIIATRVVRNGEVVREVRDGYDSRHIHFAIYNAKTTITIDLRKDVNDQVSMTNDGADYTSPSQEYSQTFVGLLHSFSPDLMGSGSKQKGGWRFTSEFAGIGSGVKSKSDPETTNLDLLLAAVAAVTKSTTLPDIKEQGGTAEFVKGAGELYGEVKEMVEKYQKGKVDTANPTPLNKADTVCCENNVLHTLENAGTHKDGFAPPPGKSTSDYPKAP